LVRKDLESNHQPEVARSGLPIDIEKERANRFRFLKLLYEQSAGNEYKWLNMWELGKELGLDSETTQRIEQYLSGERLLVAQAIGGAIGITHFGIVEMEQALSNPNQPTQHFPAVVNIIQITGDVIDSQIQQATDASQQMQINADIKRDLSAFLKSVEEAVNTLGLQESALRDITANASTIDAQLHASSPKRSIIKEALSSIRRILEGAGATLLAAEAVKLLHALK
jgi:hypothetical protein